MTAHREGTGPPCKAAGSRISLSPPPQPAGFMVGPERAPGAKNSRSSTRNPHALHMAILASGRDRSSRVDHSCAIHDHSSTILARSSPFFDHSCAIEGPPWDHVPTFTELLALGRQLNSVPAGDAENPLASSLIHPSSALPAPMSSRNVRGGSSSATARSSRSPRAGAGGNGCPWPAGTSCGPARAVRAAAPPSSAGSQRRSRRRPCPACLLVVRLVDAIPSGLCRSCRPRGAPSG